MLIGMAGSGCVMRNRLTPANLQPYTVCHFDDGLEIAEATPLTAGATSRTVDTAQGKRTIATTASERVMFRYPGTDFFANATAEELPAASYAAEKRDLIANFEYLLASSKDNARNTAMKPLASGFEIYGMDRGTLEGSVLGFYLFFDDAKHVATTVNLLNHDPAQRRFQTIEEYGRMRDRFLQRYTTCVSVSLD